MNAGEIFLTDDAALHRAFRRRDPYELDPADWEMLEGKADVLNLGQMAEREAAAPHAHAEDLAEMLEHPPTLAPGDVQVTPAMLRNLMKIGPAGYAVCRASIEPAMSDTMAALVRHLRCGEGLSYRALARWFHDSGLIVVPGQLPNNQLVGMAIADVAAAHDGQDYRDPPWNAYP